MDELDRLTADLGRDTFNFLDNWDADLVAVSIAPPQNPRRVAYISTWNKGPDRFFLELEEPGTTPDPCDYVVVGSWESIDCTEL